MVLKGKTILVVDDEADLREIVASELDFMGAIVVQAENVSQAKTAIVDHKIDLIVSDIRMPGGSGIDLLNYIKSRSSGTPAIILITGFADITAEDAFNQGAEALLSKPFKLEDLIQTAIKLTTGLEQRYSHPAKEQLKDLSFLFSEELDKKSIGRGGMRVTIDASYPSWDVGDLLSFSLKYKDVELLGTALCRWSRPVSSTSKATLGIEFVQLSDKTFAYFKDHWKDHSIIPFIPSLDSRN